MSLPAALDGLRLATAAIAMILVSAFPEARSAEGGAPEPAVFREPIRYLRSSQSPPYGEFAPESNEGVPRLPRTRTEPASSPISISGELLTSQSVSGWSGGEGEWVPLNRLAVFLEQETAELHLVVLHLLEHLGKLPYFEEVLVYPPGHRPAEGARAADVYLRVKLDRLGGETEGAPRPVLRFLGGSGFLGGFQIGYQPGQPPLPCWNFAGEVKGSSFRLGKGGDPEVAQRLSEDMGEKLFESLESELRKLREAAPPLPQLPDRFYPVARPAPRFAFLEDQGATRLLSQRHFLCPNITWWSFRSDTEPGDLFASIAQELTGEGWKEERSFPGGEEGGIGFLVMRHEEENGSLRVGTNWRNEVEFLHGDDGERKRIYFAVYQSLTPLAERRILIDELLAADPDPSPLALMPALLGWGTQHDALHRAIEDAAAEMSPEELHRVVHYLDVHFREGERARELFVLACLKALWHETSEDHQDGLEELGERLESREPEFEGSPIPLLLTLSTEQRERHGILEADGVKAGDALVRETGEPLLIRVDEGRLSGLMVYRFRPFIDDRGEGPPDKKLVLRTVDLHGERVEGEDRFGSWGHSYASYPIGPGDERETELRALNPLRFRVEIDAAGESYRVEVESGAKESP